MKKYAVALTVALCSMAMLTSSASAYYIGNKNFRLIKCEYGQMGYNWGNIGTYQNGNEIYKVFFGKEWCEV